MEEIDIIDADNNVLYVAQKDTAHEKGLLHRTIIAEIIDSDGKWSLVMQARDRQDPGKFVSPVGGHMRAGEDEISALMREAEEETGIVPEKYKRIGQAVYRRNVIGRDENHLFILYEIYSDEDLVLNHESVSYKKFTSKEIVAKIQSNEMGDAFKFVIQTFYPELMERM